MKPLVWRTSQYLNRGLDRIQTQMIGNSILNNALILRERT